MERMNPVTNWFGDAIAELHPQLQSLHRHGGDLSGTVDLVFGKGLAGIIGRRLAKKLGMPTQAGVHALRVSIRHRENSLWWSRCFNGQQTMLSIFEPTGRHPDGNWTEKTGPVNLKLAVDIIDQGWYWRLRKVYLFGLRVPLIFFPHSLAYKKIIDGNYQFHVGFSMPLVGQLLSYEGRLICEPGLIE